MYMRSTFTIQSQLQETGSGFALRDAEDRYFCGFQQEDGGIAYGRYRQVESTDGKVKISSGRSHYDKSRPVFLSLQEMDEKGIGAAVALDSLDIAYQTGLKPEITKECRMTFVRKDLTPPAAVTNGQHFRPGLASADACRSGRDAGYVSLSKQFKAGVGAVGGFVKKALGFGGPQGPS